MTEEIINYKINPFPEKNFKNLKKIMGNETSSMKIHSLLTADDLKDLRNAFPGGGASPTPVTSLNWGAWKSGLYK